MNGESHRLFIGMLWLPSSGQCEFGAPIHQSVDDAYGLSFRNDGLGYDYLVLISVYDLGRAFDILYN